MPESVVPMLATKMGAPFSRKGWLFEPKWDGYRAICFFHEGAQPTCERLHMARRHGHAHGTQQPVHPA